MSVREGLFFGISYGSVLRVGSDVRCTPHLRRLKLATVMLSVAFLMRRIWKCVNFGVLRVVG